MFWLLLTGLVLLSLYLRGFRLTVLLVAATVLSLLLLGLSFVAGGLLLFLYDPEAVRAWTLPRLGLDDLFAGSGNLLYPLAMFPFVVVADIVRGIAHILWRHPHPLLWGVMALGAWPVVLMWRQAAGAIAARWRARQ